MTSENDAEFVERIKRDWDGDNVPCVEDFDQLIAIARRGAAVQHYSGCAVHNEPAFPVGPCDCGGYLPTQLDRIEQLEAEVLTWQGHAKTAIWSDSEECKMLTRINKALIEAPTVDINVVVPDRDYSAMTPKDCYEAGLLDGVYQAREAIKAAARAALEERT